MSLKPTGVFLSIANVPRKSRSPEKIKGHNTNVWLINTGGTGGPYGTGKRIPLAHTRAMIKAARKSQLDHVQMETLPLFNFSMPVTCQDVPAGILNPRNTWDDKNRYDKKAKQLASEFSANFEKYRKGTDADVANAGPTNSKLTEMSD